MVPKEDELDDKEADEQYKPIEESIIEDLSKINSTFNFNDDLILCINIRSITKNVNKL